MLEFQDYYHPDLILPTSNFLSKILNRATDQNTNQETTKWLCDLTNPYTEVSISWNVGIFRPEAVYYINLDYPGVQKETWGFVETEAILTLDQTELHRYGSLSLVDSTDAIRMSRIARQGLYEMHHTYLRFLPESSPPTLDMLRGREINPEDFPVRTVGQVDFDQSNYYQEKQGEHGNGYSYHPQRSLDTLLKIGHLLGKLMPRPQNYTSS